MGNKITLGEVEKSIFERMNMSAVLDSINLHQSMLNSSAQPFFIPFLLSLGIFSLFAFNDGYLLYKRRHLKRKKSTHFKWLIMLVINYVTHKTED